MPWFRKKERPDSPTVDAKKRPEGPTVDAMLVLCVHEANIPVTPAAGAPLKQLAKRALGKHDSSLVLAKDAYCRFGLIEQDPTAGLMPDLGALMPDMPGVNPRHAAALMGFKPLSTMEDEAAGKLPSEMKSLLRERGLKLADYELQSFRETPDPGVRFLWMAAVRK